MSTLTTISLFTGAGGLDYGFEAAGMRFLNPEALLSRLDLALSAGSCSGTASDSASSHATLPDVAVHNTL